MSDFLLSTKQPDSPEPSKIEDHPRFAAFLKAQSEIREKATAQQQALMTITNQIRRSLDLSVICETATREIRHLLATDRVAIYQFHPDWSGRFVFESAGSQWIPLIEAQQHSELISKNVSDCSVRLLDTAKTADTHLQVTYGGSFVQGEIFRVCTDIYTAGFSDCYKEVLESYQARSYVIIAIYLDSQLWGLLATYQNSGPRQWQTDEVQLLIQIAEQIGIALKQSEYVRTIQSQSVELQQTLAALHRSQAQLIQSEKATSLTRLVAGIAHEINNPINFIYANIFHLYDYIADLLTLAQLEQNELPITRDAIREQADKIDVDFILEDLPKIIFSMRTGVERIRKIVLSLRNFSRLDESSIKTIDLHKGIESTLLVLSHRLAANNRQSEIAVIEEYGDISLVECHPAQVNQVFLALLTNAIDALNEAFCTDQPGAKNRDPRQSPQLWISTRMDEHHQAEIRIRDNGTGIASNHQSTVFDYFFTTKPVGKGTGLGLAIARQIIEDNHGGTLSLNPHCEQGAEFVICLPTALRR